MRRVGIVLVLLAVVVGCSHEPPPYTSTYVPSTGANGGLYGTPGLAEAPPLPPITLPPAATAAFIGDSWTEGYSADPKTGGYAYLTGALMGWTTEVFGAAGTGYTIGKDGVPPYPERIRSLPVNPATQIVILQGSTNDLSQSALGQDLGQAAGEAVAAVRSQFPGAALAMFGPCSTTGIADPRTSKIDKQLAVAAMRAKLHYVSCFRQKWVNAETVNMVMNPRTEHPSTEGHRYLADKLSAALRGFITISAPAPPS